MRPRVLVLQSVQMPVVSPLSLPALAFMLGVPTSIAPAVVVMTDDMHAMIRIDCRCPVDFEDDPGVVEGRW